MSGLVAAPPMSGAETMGARLAGLWPLILLIALLVATDRILFWVDGAAFGRQPRSAPLAAYAAFQAGYDPSRPQLVVIGSSRGEEAVDNATLQRALAVAVALLLGNLGLFKYFDFFSQSFVELAAAFGLGVDPIFRTSFCRSAFRSTHSRPLATAPMSTLGGWGRSEIS